MKKLLVVALLALLSAALAALVTMPSGGNAAPPAAQYGKNQPTGAYLDLFPKWTPPTYAADTPFHLSGGWPLGKGNKPPSGSDVQFVVGGTVTPATFTYTDRVGPAKRWVLNIPNGLSAGVHTLTINYLPCPSADPGPISEVADRWNRCTLSAEVTFS